MYFKITNTIAIDKSRNYIHIPEPVLTLVNKDHPRIPTTLKYETPSAAPTKPKGPAGRPQPVVFKMYKL